MDSLRIRLVGNEWVKEWTLLRTTRHKRGALGGSGLTPLVKPQRVRCKLEEAIEKPYSDILAHTPEVCKCTPSDQRMPGYQG
jgi:hypothetical protein